MPLRDRPVDFLAWHFDPKGVFSVKQAYKLKRALSEPGDAQANGIPHDAGNLDGGGEVKWKRLWKLPCPGKVRHFLWHLTHNTLATKDILCRRGMVIEDHKCFLCNARNESDKHLFVECHEIKHVWRVSVSKPADLG